MLIISRWLNAFSQVYPRTYAEAMQFIDGHRRHEIGRKLNEIRKNEGVKLRFDLSEEDL